MITCIDIVKDVDITALPDDDARFIGKIVAISDGEAAKIHNYLNEEKYKMNPSMTGCTLFQQIYWMMKREIS